MNLNESINKLAAQFGKIPFEKLTFQKDGYRVQKWLGSDGDDVMICLLRSKNTREDYHRQDYFFFNYAYKNSYKALSQKYNNLIEIKEDECYFSQPDCGYAININNIDSESVIVGVLIKKEVFFREYLSVIASSDTLFKFFLIPEKNTFSQEFIKLDFSDDSTVKNLLNLMITEYAGQDNQNILKSYTLSLLLLIARKYKTAEKRTAPLDITDKIITYINRNSGNVTLKQTADTFGYHPNYISALIRKKTGQKFIDLVLRSRMERAKILLENTNLSIEEVSDLTGYCDPGNFYRTFKKFYGTTPANARGKTTEIVSL